MEHALCFSQNCLKQYTVSIKQITWELTKIEIKIFESQAVLELLIKTILISQEPLGLLKC